jgi:hypothetical protein
MRAGRPGAGGLVRYVVTAVLVRGADSGAAVGLVLLAIDPATRLHRAAAIGGLLAAALSAPHLLGPWAGHRMDRARDGRRVLAAAYAGYGGALAAGSLALGRTPLAVAVLTGGLSSRLAAIAGPGDRSQRRAQGWDAFTYGVGGTAGPAVVAGLAAPLGPLAALLCLGAAALAAAALTMTLPAGSARPAGDAAAVSVRAGLGVLLTRPSLRQVTVTTVLAAFGAGGLPVIAAVLGPSLGGGAGAAATLTVAYGAGNLAGSLLMTVVPLRGEPAPLVLGLYAVVAGATALCSLAPSYTVALGGFALVGALNAVSFTATLAARSAYAPPVARAQVFVTSAGVKVTLGSVGSATAGAVAAAGGRALLLLAATVTAAGVIAAAADRILTGRRRWIRHARNRPATPGRRPPRCAGPAARRRPADRDTGGAGQARHSSSRIA